MFDDEMLEWYASSKLLGIPLAKRESGAVQGRTVQICHGLKEK